MPIISKKNRREVFAKLGELLSEDTSQEILTDSIPVLTEAKITSPTTETQVNQINNNQQNDSDTLDELK
ncbi:hypothetical protein ABVL58_10195 [Streptococcus infantarius]|uniref:hypothetical protein n=1 Tax=Streptococcus infantarius TaxID=102684 RepID=UPI003369BF68